MIGLKSTRQRHVRAQNHHPERAGLEGVKYLSAHASGCVPAHKVDTSEARQSECQDVLGIRGAVTRTPRTPKVRVSCQRDAGGSKKVSRTNPFEGSDRDGR